MSYLKTEHRLLDMGTGGGEFLLTLDHPFYNTVVTESYPSNVLTICNYKEGDYDAYRKKYIL
ncbi:hypothetical protein [Clostridium sp.]|uniref:hypothetical protein n=1 Tax=Clostridium sp. TaxID=1506 RepID=UPI003217C9B3